MYICIQNIYCFAVLYIFPLYIVFDEKRKCNNNNNNNNKFSFYLSSMYEMRDYVITLIHKNLYRLKRNSV